MKMMKFNKQPLFFNEMMDSFFNNEFKPRNVQANIIENKDDFNIQLNIAGFPKEAIKIKVEEEILSITGKLEEEKETQNYLSREFKIFNFERKFKLSKNTNKEGIEAKFNDGILEISIPKVVKATFTKEISIN